MKSLGERIAKLRNEKDMTQGELAKYLNLSKSALGMYEIGKREPNIKTLIEIAELFGVTLDYLLIGRDNINRTEDV